MALTPGTRLGVYEVTAQIGEGGMGQVYRARDTKLNRDVALKILPDAFASDPDRLARFTREAQTLASLNHPNIAQIYGIEGQALVMELVEGEDLSAHIGRGPIPLTEALPIAKQIAEALEAAHEQGIIHRDLKPANVKVRTDGTVKVLDFGLAKALDPVGDANVSAMNSPTLTAHGTQLGLILGTAAYMSPEQARGKVADRRADVWAFGVVLYEMLTGRRAFDPSRASGSPRVASRGEGDSVTDVLAAVLRQDIDWTALPADTPEPIRRLLRRCLEKDRRERLADMSAVRLEIKDVLVGVSAAIGAIAPGTTATPIWRRVLPWAVAAVAFIAAGTTLFLWAPWQTASPPALLRVNAELGADASLAIASIGGTPMGNTAAVSPDGTQLAFMAQPHGGGAPRLYVRRLDQLIATPLKGTEGAVGPFFSPDGQWLGFFGGDRLKKIAVNGGAPVPLAPVTNARGGTWAEDGTIIFAPSSASGLWRVSEAGGTAEQVTTLAPGEATHRWPQAIPGGRAVLYTVSPATANNANAWLAVQPLPNGTPRIVQRGAFYGRYLPSERGSSTRAMRESGHLTWVQDGTLFAAPFDLATLAETGAGVPVVSDVMSRPNPGLAQVEGSRTGTLVYLPGGDNTSAAAIDWLTRDGKTTPLRATPANWSSVQIAPDGRRLAISLIEASNEDVWTYDATRAAPTRLTVDTGPHRSPIWTPNGLRLVYSSQSSGSSTALNLWWQPANGSGPATRLTTSPNNQTPGSWHKSGGFLAFSENRPQTSADLMILPLEGDEASGWKPGKPFEILAGPSSETQPRFSPDGRWLAYQSNESGTFEISVRPFQRPGGTTTISTGGGTNAVWSRARNELLYLAPDGRLMVVPYTAAGDVFQPGKATVWSETAVQFRSATGASFDLDPDGTRVAMAPRTQATTDPTHVTLIFNFFDELRRLAPVTKR